RAGTVPAFEQPIPAGERAVTQPTLSLGNGRDLGHNRNIHRRMSVQIGVDPWSFGKGSHEFF
ncbi:MAG TPA: hypothetical protein VJN72_14580, partial [Gaiellales bacterium]|nr:hypothetical protein [Gaiellales bacterium]